MACTNDYFQLEKDIPNVYTVFALSPQVIQNAFQKQETIEINYKRLFRRLTGRKRSAAVVLDNKSPSQSQSESNNTVSDPLRASKPSNRFETLIDRLERKYYALSNIQSSVDTMVGSEGEESSNISASNHGSPDLLVGKSGGSSPEINSKKKSKKKKFVTQDYDYSDPFIDDSEVVEELEQVIHTKRMKTKHDGFFVSSGDLEVVKMKKLPTPKPSTTLPATTESTNSANPNLTIDTTSISSNANQDNAKSSKASKKSGKEVASTAPSTDVNYFHPELSPAKEGMISSPAKPVKKEKPAWNPHPDVQEAMEQFKNAVTEFYATTSTKNLLFPLALEQPLLQLDAIVKQHHSEKELSKTTGYYESLQTIIGKGFTGSKLKTIIIRIQHREQAKVCREKVDKAMTQLQTDLTASIIDCPAEKQPANKKPRKPKDSSSSNATALSISAPANDTTTTSHSDNPVANLEKAPANGEDNSIAGTSSMLCEQSQTEMMDVSTLSETLNTSSDVIDPINNMGAPQISNKESNLEDFVAQNQPEESNPVINPEKKKSSAPLIEYKYYCPWNLHLRQQLLRIENLIEEWVMYENLYRDKLFSSDRKYMHASEYVPLVATIEITKAFDQICLIFPELCLQGDISTLKKQLATEKRRLKPKPPPITPAQSNTVGLGSIRSSTENLSNDTEKTQMSGKAIV